MATSFADRVLTGLGPTFRDAAGATTFFDQDAGHPGFYTTSVVGFEPDPDADGFYVRPRLITLHGHPGFYVETDGLLGDLVAALASGIDHADKMIQPADPDATSWIRWWPAAFDLQATPDPAWLGATLGTKIPGGLTTEETRAYVGGRTNWRRGTPAALRAAIAATLTGSRHIEITERDGGPWRLTIHTFEAETPDPAATLAAVLTQKPVGIVVAYQVVAGASYQHFADVHGPTFADDAAEFPTAYDMYTHLPE